MLHGQYDLLDRLRAYKVRPAPDDPPGKYETGTHNHADVVCPWGSPAHWRQSTTWPRSAMDLQNKIKALAQEQLKMWQELIEELD